MKKLISLILAVALVTSVAVIPTEAADAWADKVKGRIPQDYWTAREVPEGTVVTLPENPEVVYGSLDYEAVWSDALNAMPYWWDGGKEDAGNADWKPFTLSKDVKLEGEGSICVDISTAMAALSKQDPPRLPIMGLTGVYVAPCADGEAYRLRFYVKADRELGYEQPSMLVYFLHEAKEGEENAFKNVKGTTNVMVESSNIDYHWYDQNEIRFATGQNMDGAIPQGYGAFNKGKWIQIDAYFVTPPEFPEAAYTIQIQTQSAGDCKLYFDAISLEKISMDDVDMGVPLKMAPAPAKKVKFTKSKVTIKKGKKTTLKIKNAKKVTFSVDKKGKKVVKLSKKKAKSVVVKGIKKGKATITAKAKGKKATCKVTVK